MSASEIKAGGAYVELGAKSGAFDKAMDAMRFKLASCMDSVGSLGTKLESLGSALANFGSSMTRPLIDAAKQFADYGETIGKLHAKTGFSNELLGGLQYAAEGAGISMSALSGAIRTMQKTGTGSSAEDFLSIVDVIAGIQDPGEKAEAAMEAFGRAGVEILPIIENGADEIKRLTREAGLLNYTLGDQAMEAASNLDEALDRVQAGMKGLALQIGAAVYPVIKPLVDRFIDLVVAASTWINQNPELLQSYAKVGIAILGIGTALASIGTALMVIAMPAVQVAAIVALIAAGLLLVTDALGVTNTGFGDLFNSIKLWGVGITDILKYVGKAFSLGFEIIVDLGSSAWKALGSGFGAVIDWITSAFTSAIDMIRKHIDALIDILHEIGRAMDSEFLTNIPNIGQVSIPPVSAMLAAGVAMAKGQIDQTVHMAAAGAEIMGIKLPQGNGKTGIDTDEAKAAVLKIVDGLWDGLGSVLERFMGKIPRTAFEAKNDLIDATEVRSKLDQQGPTVGAVGTFSSFVGGNIAGGIFSQQLGESKKQTQLLGSIDRKLSVGGFGLA